MYVYGNKEKTYNIFFLCIVWSIMHSKVLKKMGPKVLQKDDGT